MTKTVVTLKSPLFHPAKSFGAGCPALLDAFGGVDSWAEAPSGVFGYSKVNNPLMF